MVMGVVGDGAVKVLLGAAFVVGANQIGHLLGVPIWLMVGSGVALLIGGGTEIGYVRSRPMRTYTRLMVAYDSGWVLAALAGVLVAWRGSDGGGEVWVGYQTAAPLALAVFLVAACSERAASAS
ncbi:hypothetical protein NGF19_02300 [Streptomyces sp. RY43-2]|uniref:Integral membrane protein n=2 Tax=Streptomyces macrolidinus TaxID=2952607 RepID=A0ABT0Z7R3_9ACTN|nr:hypothetical protein [Streptomyces macrolidinus]MCN9239621.1 hypothetical protein [Streptomyces macrolidinus]